MKYNRLLVLITPVGVLILLELFIIKPKLIYLALGLAFILVTFTLWRFIKDVQSELRKLYFINSLVLPTLFLVSVSSFLILLSSKLLVQLLVLGTVVFIYVYLRTIYNHSKRLKVYHNVTLENVSSFGNLLVFFFASSAVYGLQSFLNLQIWIIILAIMPIIFLVFYQLLWAYKINFKFGLVFILIGSVILIELAWSISFLPLNYIVSGLVLAICYYGIAGFIRYYLTGILNKKAIKLYIATIIISIFLIFLTAQWL